MSKWPMVKLGDICEIITGSTPSKSRPEYYGGSIPWIKPDDLDRTTYVDSSSEYLTEEGARIARTLPTGAVLFSCIGNIGKLAIARKPLATNQQINSLIPSTRVDSLYLYYACRHVQPTVKAQASSTTVPIVNKSSFSRVEIPLPPLDEQRRIAAILDKADALRQKRRQAIAKLDELAQATFLEMFGDPVTNPMGWPIKKLGTIGTLDRGVSKHRPRNDPALLGGKHPLVQTGEVANSSGYIREYKNTYSDLGLRQSKMWPKGTLCITIAANIAKTGILTFDACFPDSVVGFLDKEPATIEYIRIWLSFLQKTLEESAPESAQKNINLAILRDLNVPFPPIDLQKKFVMIIHQGELQRSIMQKEHIGLDKLFSSLQSDAFSGEIS